MHMAGFVLNYRPCDMAAKEPRNLNPPQRHGINIISIIFMNPKLPAACSLHPKPRFCIWSCAIARDRQPREHVRHYTSNFP